MPPRKRGSAPATPSTPPRASLLPPKTPKIAALTAAANRLKTGPTPGRNNHAQEGSFVAPVIVESSRYEEWMKMATDNVC